MSEANDEAMQGPPIHVEPEGFKPELRKTGRRNLDLLIASVAILLSLISLAVAVGNARTQERMVAAASWPFLTYATTNFDQEAKRSAVLMSVRNVGVGPAIIRDFKVRYKGQPVRTSFELLHLCCGFAPGSDFSTLDEPTPPKLMSLLSPADFGRLDGFATGSVQQVITPDNDVTFISLARDPDPELFRRLNLERNALSFEVCYCSVLETCWTSDLRSMRPKEVRACPARGPQTYVE